MGKNKKGFAVILMILAGLLAIIAAVLYRGVMYKMSVVYALLIAAAVLACVSFVIAGKLPKLTGYIPVITAALLASAAVWGSNLMVNQLGYVVAGLDGMDTIMPYIQFMGCTIVAMLLSIIAAFMPMAKPAK